MPDRRLAVVFRNPHPQRSAIRTELYLFRRDGSSVHIYYPDRGDLQQPVEPTAPIPGMRPTDANSVFTFW